MELSISTLPLIIIFTLICVVSIIILVIVLLKNKNKYEVKVTNVTDDEIKKDVENVNLEINKVKEESLPVIKKEVEVPSKKEEVKDDTPLPVVKVDVGALTDEEVTPVKSNPLIEDNTSEEVTVTKGVPLEETVNTSEVIEVRKSEMDPNDEGESVELPIRNVLTEENGEEFEIPSLKHEEKILPGDKTIAFNSLPSDIKDINTDIQYELPKEYTGVKTEILNLDEINELKGKDEN